MSEYQYYEFLAIDRPLSQEQMAELRALSTRATITPTRFQNVYHWGDFRGKPSVLMEKYFDAFVYVANWGTRWCMLRLPRRLLEPEMAELYCRCDEAEARAKDDFVILEFRSEMEGGGDWVDGEEWMASLVSVRADLASGDLRALYLGWLLCAQSGSLDDEDTEPPVPPGLGSPSAPLEALANFLRIDEDLIAVAAERSAPLQGGAPAGPELATWIRGLPASEKDALLLRVIEEGDPNLRSELLQRFRRSRAPATVPAAGTAGGGRTVAELVSAAEERAELRAREEAERKAREEERLARERAAARANHLDSLAGREEELWQRVEALVGAKRPKEYDQAVELLGDLRDLAARGGGTGEFDRRLGALRQQHAGKPSFMERLDKARLRPTALR